MKKEKNNPNFICIAPHKTGTTWLYTMLKQHSEIWLPPKKELWILNQLDTSCFERLHNYFRRTGMAGDNWRYFENDLNQIIRGKHWHHDNLSRIQWWLYFLFAPYSLNSYPKFFFNKSNQVSGDITPNYYFLNEGIIEELAQKNSNTKIIIILRNPVERAWSYIRMQIKNKQQGYFDNPSEDELSKYFSDLHAWWKPYVTVIKIWSEKFPNFHIGYYDQIKETPHLFYKNICSFLDIKNNFVPNNLSQTINKGSEIHLPSKIRKQLNEMYLPETLDLSKLTKDPYVYNWSQSMENS